MNELKQAAQMALEAMEQVTFSETFYRDPRGDHAGPAIDALRSALRQPDEATRPSMSMFASAADYSAAMTEWLNAGGGKAESEFWLYCNGDFVASASGPHAEAVREIQHYAGQYAQDGPVEIEQVTRVKLGDAALLAALGEAKK